MEQTMWNSKSFDGETVEHMMVEERNISWWNSGTSDRGTVEHMMVEQWNR